MNDKLLKGIEYSFYLMILLYLVGKSFEILTVVIDILFLVYIAKNRDLFISKGILPLCPSANTAYLCFNKFAMFEYLKLDYR